MSLFRLVRQQSLCCNSSCCVDSKGSGPQPVAVDPVAVCTCACNHNTPHSPPLNPLPASHLSCRCACTSTADLPAWATFPPTTCAMCMGSSTLPHVLTSCLRGMMHLLVGLTRSRACVLSCTHHPSSHRWVTVGLLLPLGDEMSLGLVRAVGSCGLVYHITGALYSHNLSAELHPSPIKSHVGCIGDV
jgi:hypothetical protein